jgi:hypothetical protein
VTEAQPAQSKVAASTNAAAMALMASLRMSRF